MILAQWFRSFRAPVLIHIYYIEKIDPGYSLKMAKNFGTTQVKIFSFTQYLSGQNLLVWLNVLTIFTWLIQRNYISCALREASICSKYIYQTETDPCIVTGLQCLSYLNIWGWTCFLHFSQLRPSCMCLLHMFSTDEIASLWTDRWLS